MFQQLCTFIINIINIIKKILKQKIPLDELDNIIEECVKCDYIHYSFSGHPTPMRTKKTPNFESLQLNLRNNDGFGILGLEVGRRIDFPHFR